MKLDKFQQLVKNLNTEPDLNATEAKLFIRKLYDEFQDKVDDIESNVNGTIDFGQIFGNSVYQTESMSTQTMDNAITYHTNNLIKTTLEEIEDIEEYNKTEVEPEDCMDTIKRHWELEQ